MRQNFQIAALATALLLGAFHEGCADDSAQSSRAPNNYYYDKNEPGYYADDYPTDGYEETAEPPLWDDRVEEISESQSDTCNTESEVLFAVLPEKADATAGATLARAYIEAGLLIDFPIRPNEFLNYYRPAVSDAMSGYSGGITVTSGIATSEPIAEDRLIFDLYVALSSPGRSDESRRPVNLTILLDTSASMAGRALTLAKQICGVIANGLTAEDTISIVAPIASDPVLLSPVAGSEQAETRVSDTLDGIGTTDGIDLTKGFETAYEINRKNAESTATNRIVLISNGDWDIGITDKDFIAAEASREAGDAVRLAPLGVASSPADYNISMMRALSEAGRGAHMFIDSSDEADSALLNDIARWTDLAVSEISFTLSLPPSFTLVRAAQQPGDTQNNSPPVTDIAPSGIMTFFNQATACDTRAADTPGDLSISASFVDPQDGETGVAHFTEPIQNLLSTEDLTLTKVSAVVEYAKTLHDTKTLAPDAARERIDRAVYIVKDAIDATDDDDLKAIRALLEDYKALL